MSHICKYCSSTNQDGSIYCNNCGRKISGNGNGNNHHDDYINEQADIILDKLREEINEEAIEVKFKTLEAFQENATKWVKNQFTAATAAISLVIAILAYAGIDGFYSTKQYQEKLKEYENNLTDYQEELKLNKKNMDNDIASFKKKRADFDASVINAYKKIDGEMSKLKNFDTKKITLYKNDLEKKIKEITKLKENYKKLENSRFKIIVHYRGATISEYHKNIKTIDSVLHEKGYILDKDNIANVSADYQEILYFSDSVHIKEKVQEIQKLLLGKFKPIPIHYEGSGNLDPLEVVVKLCPGGRPFEENKCSPKSTK